MYQILQLKKKYFFLTVGMLVMLQLSPVPVLADTGETVIITQEECKDSLKGILKNLTVKVSLPEGELDFSSLTLYFLNEAEGCYYQVQIGDVTQEAKTTVCLPPGIYRLDNSFTQFDGFYNLNYTSQTDAEVFEVDGNIAESGEVLVKIKRHLITQYENNLVLHYKNGSDFPGSVRLTLEGNTDLDNSSYEKYEVELKEGDTETSLLMKAGTYRVTDASLEFYETGEKAAEGWNLQYEKGDIVIRHHGDTDLDVSVSKKEPERDKADAEGKKFSAWMLLEFFPVLLAVGYGMYKLISSRIYR